MALTDTKDILSISRARSISQNEHGMQLTNKSSQLISIVIPALNEEEGIGKTISEIPVDELKKLGFELEILVVDGNSFDRTRMVAKEKGAKVIIEPRKGYGRAYKTGFSYAKGDFIVTFDADASYPAFDIPRILKIFEAKNLDFLSTNRFGKIEKGAMGTLNSIGNRLLSLVIRILFSINLMDSQSGMWVIRTEIIPKILPDSNGMPFSEEIKIRAFKDFKALEVPIVYRKRLGQKKLKVFKDGLYNLLYLLKLWIKLKQSRC